MTAPSATLQQQLAEVEKAAQRERRPVVVQAARMGRHDVLAHLLRVAGSGAGGMSKDGRSAAFLAASSVGHERCLRGLLEASPPTVVADLVRATDGKGRNGLILAASNGRTSCVRLLLQHSPGVQVTHAAGYGGRNALVAACTLGYAECVELLLQHNPKAQVALTSTGGNALLWAAMNGHPACVRLLLAHSPQLQRLDRALFYAAYHQPRRRQLSGGGGDETPRSCLQCMELLLSKGAMLSAGTPAEEFAFMRRVIQDLAARALAPDMADEATAQAARQLRRREAKVAVDTRVALAVASTASHGEVTAGARAGAPVQQQERKRGHACGSCDDGARRRRK